MGIGLVVAAVFAAAMAVAVRVLLPARLARGATDEADRAPLESRTEPVSP